jgi:aminobenzoyl-glutamate transport protein
MNTFLKWIERIGNKLPHPVSLFVILSLIVLFLSMLLSALGLSSQHPTTGSLVSVNNLLTRSAMQELFTKGVEHFALFPPLGLVLVTMLGVGVAENSGWISAALRSLVRAIPKSLLDAGVIFAGIMSSLAADAGYVVLVPLGALIFKAAGRPPMAGLALAFAGVSGGFCANLFITSLDPLLSSLTEQAAQLVTPNAQVPASSNYYFMVASVFMLTIVGTLVNRLWVEKRLEKENSQDSVVLTEDTHLKNLSPRENKALKISLLTLFTLIGITLISVIPSDSFFRSPEGSLDPFYKSLVLIIMLVFLIVGLVYGILAGSIRSDKDAVNMASDSMASMGTYIVLAFFMAQFLALFRISNMGTVIAIQGAEFLSATGVNGSLLLVLFIFMTGFVNLFVGSASAKWALLAPVFVPMLMLVGIDPELTQAAYRIADSSTNIISPLLPYLPLILVVAQKYSPKGGLGTLVATMLPYSLSFTFIWTLMLLIWGWLNLPLGF